MGFKKQLPLTIVASISLVVSQAYAATDAGQILQQIERDVEINPLPVQPMIEEMFPVKISDQGPKVVIHEFRLQGNQVLSNLELQSALIGLANREISISELKSSMGLIASLYKKKGYLASVDLPDQDVTDGVVTIKIVEVALGQVKLDGEYNKDYKRVRPEVIERMLGADKLTGKVLEQNKLDEALARLNALSGVRIASGMTAGSKNGTVDVLLKVKDQPLLSTYLSVDNTGGRQTGRNRGLAYLTLASPFGFGEIVNITGLKSEGVDYGKLGVLWPVGPSGLRVGASASYMYYDIVTGVGVSTQSKGHSSTLGVIAQYPVLTTYNGKLVFTAEAEQKNFVNKSVDATTNQDYDVQVYSAALMGDYKDNFLAGAVNNASINIGNGDVDISGSSVKHIDGDSKGYRTQGTYTRLRWNLNRNQFLTDSVVLSLSGSGQWANANLDSSEKFYLGGASGVRAYPTSEGGGSEGYLWTAELRKYVTSVLSVSTFIDHGWVRQFEDNTPGMPTEQNKVNSEINTYSLKGYGFSVNWQGPYNTNFKATYAHRMGNNPNVAANGNDQDGTRILDVFWVNGSISF